MPVEDKSKGHCGRSVKTLKSLLWEISADDHNRLGAAAQPLKLEAQPLRLPQPEPRAE